MKATTCAGVVVLILGGRLALAGEGERPSMRVRPIQVTSWDDAPPGLAFDMMPMPWCRHQAEGHPGFQVSYLVEGQDLAGFHSVTIDTIKTPEGTDISKYRDGKRAYEAGVFPRRTSEDGKYCVFSLNVSQNQFGKVEKLAIKGHVTLLVGTKWEEKKIDLQASDKVPTKVGPFSIRVDQSQQSDSVGVEITPRTGLIQAEFAEGDVEVEPSGSGESNNARTYYLPRPKAGKFTLALRYWVDMKKVTIPIGP